MPKKPKKLKPVFSDADNTAMFQRIIKPRSSPFDPNYAPYGHAKTKGSPDEWRSAYEQRMFGLDEAVQILDKENPYTVLGLAQGADKVAVKQAYRHIVITKCTAALSLDPDPAVVELFKKVHAAYSFLMGN